MKTNRIILAALFISAAVSCQKESFAGLENPRETESATIIAGEPTKTSLNGNEVHWTSDDVIAVFDNFGYKNIFNITQAEASYASFSGEVTSGTEQIYAVYPASLAESVSGRSIKVNVPVDQTSKVSSFAEEHNISVAKGTKTPGVETIENITFKNVCSYLKFTIPTYIEDAKSVTFSTSRAIAGPATVDASADTPVAVVGEGGSKSVTMTGSYPAGSQFMFVLTPGTIQGFTVTVVTDKATWTITRNSEVSFAPGQYKNLGTLELEQVGVSATATHTYSGSTLTGTTVNVALNVPTATLQYASDLKIEVRNAAGTVVRSASSSTLTSSETLAATQDWPYLPQGTYTVSGSYKLGDVVKNISDTFTSPAPVFEGTATVKGTTSYSIYYNNGGTKNPTGANDHAAETISAISASCPAVANISSEILAKIPVNYSITLDGSELNKGTTTSTAAIGVENQTGKSWGKHTLAATFTFDGVAITGETTCHITGLPYTKDFTTTTDLTNWEYSDSRTNSNQRFCEYNTGKTDGYELAYGYTYTSRRDFFSPVFHVIEDDIPVTYNVNVVWWQTGAKASNTTSRLNVGVTSETSRNSSKQMDMPEASKSFQWGIESSGTLTDENSSLTTDKNRIGIYVDNKTWSNSATQHYVVLNYFQIRYR